MFFFRGEGWHNPLNIWIGTIKKLSKKECRKKAVVNDRGSAWSPKKIKAHWSKLRFKTPVVNDGGWTWSCRIVSLSTAFFGTFLINDFFFLEITTIICHWQPLFSAPLWSMTFFKKKYIWRSRPLLVIATSLHLACTPSTAHAAICKHEVREIRTPNLLIWSQTRYRCAIAPFKLPCLRWIRNTCFCCVLLSS